MRVIGFYLFILYVSLARISNNVVRENILTILALECNQMNSSVWCVSRRATTTINEILRNTKKNTVCVMNIIQTVAYKRWAFFLQPIDVVTIETELMYLLWQVWQVHFLPVHTTTRTWQFNSCVTIWLPCHNVWYVPYWYYNITYFILSYSNMTTI